MAEGKAPEISREIKLIGVISEAQMQRLMEIADKCPVHKLLAAGAKIETRRI